MAADLRGLDVTASPIVLHQIGPPQADALASWIGADARNVGTNSDDLQAVGGAVKTIAKKYAAQFSCLEDRLLAPTILKGVTGGEQIGSYELALLASSITVKGARDVFPT